MVCFSEIFYHVRLVLIKWKVCIEPHYVVFQQSELYNCSCKEEIYFVLFIQFGAKSGKPPKGKKVSKKQKEVPPDPGLNEELLKVDRMSESQMDTELASMLVSGSLFTTNTL